MNLNKAIEIAAKVHDGQVDKGGAPYILHPLRVMMEMDTDDERIVAVLHDVLEGAGTLARNIESLREEACLETHLMHSLLCLTRRWEETYTQYLIRVSRDRLARKVKIADLRDNMRIERIPNPTPYDWVRMHRYIDAHRLLREEDMRDLERISRNERF